MNKDGATDDIDIAMAVLQHESYPIAQAIHSFNSAQPWTGSFPNNYLVMETPNDAYVTLSDAFSKATAPRAVSDVPLRDCIPLFYGTSMFPATPKSNGTNWPEGAAGSADDDHNAQSRSKRAANSRDRGNASTKPSKTTDRQHEKPKSAKKRKLISETKGTGKEATPELPERWR